MVENPDIPGRAMCRIDVLDGLTDNEVLLRGAIIKIDDIERISIKNYDFKKSAERLIDDINRPTQGGTT